MRRRRGPRGERRRKGRARFTDASTSMQPQLVNKALSYATERTHTLLALKASEQRYRELFQNVTAGRVPDDARRQVHGGQSRPRAHARLRQRGRAGRARRRARHLHGPGAAPGNGRGDDARRRDAQRRDGAQAQRRLEDRRARELARGARRGGARAVLRGHADRHHGVARAVAAALLRCVARRS